MHVIHAGQHTTLSGYRDAIVREVDGVALRVGRLLREAKELATPIEFNRWVINDLPFGLETARRLMAISAAYEKLPTEALRDLPRPWQAMYALKELPPIEIIRAIRDGEIHTEMTVEEARHYARSYRKDRKTWRKDANRSVARVFTNFAPSDVSPPVLDKLREWLNS